MSRRRRREEDSDKSVEKRLAEKDEIKQLESIKEHYLSEFDYETLKHLFSTYISQKPTVLIKLKQYSLAGTFECYRH